MTLLCKCCKYQTSKHERVSTIMSWNDCYYRGVIATELSHIGHTIIYLDALCQLTKYHIR